ncbi:MAG: hypothetical protein KatS3mg102_0039 [Planctomycetota bacterium]|nr:MAG: hypothetical protein KatS3mg102_0039 [Planctomycetota bacterium]
MPISLAAGSGRGVLEAGTLFGEVSCLSCYPRSATCSAAGPEPTECLEMTRAALEFAKERAPAFRSRIEAAYRQHLLAPQLRSVPVFAALSDEFAEYLRQHVEFVTFEPETVICAQDEPADACYLIRVGYVRVSQRRDGAERMLRYLGPGDLFGEVGLVLGGLRTATCTALDRVELVKLRKADFDLLLQSFPAIASRLHRAARALLAAERRAAAPAPMATPFDESLMGTVGHLLAQLRSYTRELERSNTDLQSFAHIAAHELREPARTITTYLGLLAERRGELLDAEARRWLEHAADAARRMQELVAGLLAYARVGSQGGPLQNVSAEQALAQALADLAAAIEQSGARIHHDPLPAVRADPAQLVQLLRNLLDNAIKYSGGRTPEIHISARRGEKGWIFAVRDRGLGVEPEHQQRIFDMMQRLHTRAEIPGSGMGLAICKRIVERHGGRIGVESEPGRGSTFWFSIPESHEPGPAAT